MKGDTIQDTSTNSSFLNPSTSITPRRRRSFTESNYPTTYSSTSESTFFPSHMISTSPETPDSPQYSQTTKNETGDATNNLEHLTAPESQKQQSASQSTTVPTIAVTYTSSPSVVTVDKITSPTTTSEIHPEPSFNEYQRRYSSAHSSASAETILQSSNASLLSRPTDSPSPRDGGTLSSRSGDFFTHSHSYSQPHSPIYSADNSPVLQALDDDRGYKHSFNAPTQLRRRTLANARRARPPLSESDISAELDYGIDKIGREKIIQVTYTGNTMDSTLLPAREAQQSPSRVEKSHWSAGLVDDSNNNIQDTSKVVGEQPMHVRHLKSDEIAENRPLTVMAATVFPPPSTQSSFSNLHERPREPKNVDQFIPPEIDGPNAGKIRRFVDAFMSPAPAFSQSPSSLSSLSSTPQVPVSSTSLGHRAAITKALRKAHSSSLGTPRTPSPSSPKYLPSHLSSSTPILSPLPQPTVQSSPLLAIVVATPVEDKGEEMGHEKDEKDETGEKDDKKEKNIKEKERKEKMGENITPSLPTLASSAVITRQSLPYTERARRLTRRLVRRARHSFKRLSRRLADRVTDFRDDAVVFCVRGGIHTAHAITRALSSPSTALLLAGFILLLGAVLFLPTPILGLSATLTLALTLALVPLAYAVYEQGLLQLLPGPLRALRPFLAEQSLLQLSELRWSTGVLTDALSLFIFDMSTSDRAAVVARLPESAQKVLQRRVTDILPDALSALLLSRPERERARRVIASNGYADADVNINTNVDMGMDRNTNTEMRMGKTNIRGSDIEAVLDWDRKLTAPEHTSYHGQSFVRIPSFQTPPPPSHRSRYSQYSRQAQRKPSSQLRSPSRYAHATTLFAFPTSKEFGEMEEMGIDDTHNTTFARGYVRRRDKEEDESDHQEEEEGEEDDYYDDLDNIEKDDLIFSPLKIFFSNLEDRLLKPTLERRKAAGRSHQSHTSTVPLLHRIVETSSEDGDLTTETETETETEIEVEKEHKEEEKRPNTDTTVKGKAEPTALLVKATTSTSLRRGPSLYSPSTVIVPDPFTPYRGNLPNKTAYAKYYRDAPVSLVEKQLLPKSHVKKHPELALANTPSTTYTTALTTTPTILAVTPVSVPPAEASVLHPRFDPHIPFVWSAAKYGAEKMLDSFLLAVTSLGPPPIVSSLASVSPSVAAATSGPMTYLSLIRTFAPGWRNVKIFTGAVAGLSLLRLASVPSSRASLLKRVSAVASVGKKVAQVGFLLAAAGSLAALVVNKGYICTHKRTRWECSRCIDSTNSADDRVTGSLDTNLGTTDGCEHGCECRCHCHCDPTPAQLHTEAAFFKAIWERCVSAPAPVPPLIGRVIELFVKLRHSRVFKMSLLGSIVLAYFMSAFLADSTSLTRRGISSLARSLENILRAGLRMLLRLWRMRAQVPGWFSDVTVKLD